MEARAVAALGQIIAAIDCVPDTGPALDAVLARLLAALSAMPAMQGAAVVLIDDEDKPVIRSTYGRPDVGLILSGTLGRPADPGRPFVLTRDGQAVQAEASGEPAVFRPEAAMLGAPIEAGTLAGWLFADTLHGPDRPLGDDLGLIALAAAAVGRLLAVNRCAAAGKKALSQEIAFLRSKVSLSFQHVFSVGNSRELEALRGETKLAAGSDAPLVLSGETGSGRAVLAKVIHELSGRAVRPFLTFIPDDLPDAAVRLFGAAPGSGSPAGPGLIEEAAGGTVCISRAEALPPEVKERLARFLKTGEFSRVGSSRVRTADTRLLFKAGPQGLPPDLLPAGSSLRLRVPPLRERREDIPELLAYFLHVEEQRTGRRLTFTPKALKALEAYDWPGNIREMETLAARLALTAPEARVDIADIPSELLAEGERPPVLPEDAAELKDMERQQVLSALERHNWVQSRAARELGLTLRQIGYRIRKYNLAREDGAEPEAGEQES